MGPRHIGVSAVGVALAVGAVVCAAGRWGSPEAPLVVSRSSDALPRHAPPSPVAAVPAPPAPRVGTPARGRLLPLDVTVHVEAVVEDTPWRLPPPATGLVVTAAVMTTLTAILDGADRGDVLVILDGGEVLLQPDTLTALGILHSGATPEDRDGPWLRLSALPLKFSVDEFDLRLILEVAPEHLAGTTVDLGHRGPPKDIEYAHDASAWLNYGARLTDLSRVDGYGEIGGSWRAARVYAAFTVPAGTGPVRGLSNVIVDLREDLLRLTAGDAYASGGALGGSAFVGGAQVSRTLALDPYLSTVPSLDRDAIALAPSTLEVWVDGRLVHRVDVDPGPIHIEDIPANVGAGDTRIVLRDVLGRERAVTQGFYRPTGLLPRGTQEYSYTVGFQRANLGTRSWDYGAPAALGAHRVGLGAVTVGARAEAALDRVNAGVEAVASAPIGQLELAAAASYAGAPGGAASLAWTWSSRGVGVSAWGRARSEAYTTLGLDAAADRTVGEAGGAASVRIARGVSLSGSYAIAEHRDQGASHRATLSSGVQLPSRFSVGALATWTRAEDDDASLWLSVNRTFGRRTTASLRVEAPDLAANAELSRSLPSGPGVGYRVGARVGVVDQGYAYVDGQTTFGRAGAAIEASPAKISTAFTASGGLVAIGGRVLPSRPVERGFALVRVPGVHNVRAYLNNNEVGRTDRRGDLLVPGLAAWYANRLSIADLDVPLDYTVGATERVIAPPERGGAVVRFAVTPARIVRGRVPVAALGTLCVPSEGLCSPIGTDGRFEFLELGPGTWTAEARSPAGRCALSLDVGERSDLGDLPCEVP